jgi:hypothetical protein
MFFLSKNILKEIIQEGNLFEKASNQDFHSDTPISKIRSFKNSPIIVKCIDLNNLNNVFCSLKLYDGEGYATVILDNNSYDANGRKLSSLSDQNNRDIEKNSILILSEYSIVKFKYIIEILKSSKSGGHKSKYSADQVSSVENEPILLINLFYLIGIDLELQIDNRIMDKEKKIVLNDEATIVDKKQKISYNEDSEIGENRILIPTHKICSLTPRVSLSDWSIVATVVKKNPIKTFVNKNTGNSGMYGRLQLRDENDFIELVAFNEPSYLKLFDSLELNTTYIIRNADICSSKKEYQAWRQSNTSNYEISVNKKTTFKLYPKLEVENVNQIIDTPIQAQTSNKKNENKSKTIKLSNLSHQPINSLVTVIGIVVSIEKECSHIETKTGKLSIRRFLITDDTSTTVSVALWGAQAENLDIVENSIILLNDCKLVSYGGLSLSVIRISGYIDITNNELIPDTIKLKEWWNINKEKEKSSESIKKKRKH